MHLLCCEPIGWLVVQFETPLTEAADEGPGHQGHARDGQQLQQTLPGNQVIERRHLRQHDSRLHADEVVRQEAYQAHEEKRAVITASLLTKGPSLLHSPTKTEQKNSVMGMLTMGADMLRNQLGVMGKNLRNSRKKNKQSWLSSTWKTQEKWFYLHV